MKKILIVFFAIFCWHTSMVAEDIILRVILNNGTQNDYILAERPQISFGESKITFTYRNATTDYVKSDLQNFVFLDSSTGISPMRAGDTRVTYREEAGRITVEGIDDKGQIQIYAISGIQYNAVTSQIGNGIEIMLTGLPKGYYIIKIGNNQSIKISKK